MYNEYIKDKHFYIIGLARSGLSSAAFLQANGATVTVWDDTKSKLQGINESYSICSPETVDWSTITAVLLSPGVRYSYPEPHIAVRVAQSKGIPVINDVILFCDLHKNDLLIGITGTNGKSTTTALTAHILSGLGFPATAIGNIGVPVFGSYPEEGLIRLIEVSSFQLELMKKSPFSIAVLLNLSAHHLDRHGNMENYINAKMNIFNHGEQLRVIGGEDHYTRNVGRHLAVTLQSKANIITTSSNETTKEGIWIDDRRIYIKMPDLTHEFGNTDRYQALRGSHNHQNIASSLGIICHVFAKLGKGCPDWDKIDDLLQTFEALPHRQQLVLTQGNVTIINDSKATNVASAKRSLSAFSNILWLVGGRFTDDDIDFEKKHLKNLVHGYAYGEASRPLEKAISPMKPCTSHTSLAEALAHAKAYADMHKEQHFTLLLAPACVSFDQFSDFEERGNVFMKLAKEIFG
ncbi:MAG: UDP-N-acetylmuramoyl-L-alanine--D-glutamate ligase [Alphaproteobacteria bacterium]|nr:MAG: UDP-N-acetylmuramoyl-L-alanine--D-glutamate ligase [Alphaproteobacteria bacterium]